jgi:hypothetical protein
MHECFVSVQVKRKVRMHVIILFYKIDLHKTGFRVLTCGLNFVSNFEVRNQNKKNKRILVHAKKGCEGAEIYFQSSFISTLSEYKLSSSCYVRLKPMKSVPFPTEYVSVGPRVRLRFGRTERSVTDEALKQESASVLAAAKNSVLLDCYTLKTVVIRSLQAAVSIHQLTRSDIPRYLIDHERRCQNPNDCMLSSRSRYKKTWRWRQKRFVLI